MTAETRRTSADDRKDLVSTSELSSDTAGVATDERLPKRAKLIIWLLLASAFVVILNETIMGVALPSLIRDLGISAATAQWLTTAYLQDVLRLDTLQTGLMLLPGGVAMGVAAPIVGRLFDRFGSKPLVTPGAVLFSASLWGLTTVNEMTDVALVIAIHVALNIGLGFMLTPLLTAALGSLPKNLYSHGSEIVNTLQQVAGAAGTALFITLMTTGTVAATAAGSDAVTAQVSGVHTAFVWGAWISLLSVLLSLFVARPAAVDRSLMTAH